MAARDEKISNNRRRLFKALSAAPVVATLKPGSALATSSAYQCLSSGHDIADWHPDSWQHIGNPCPSGSGEACYVYVRRKYINTDDVGPYKNRDCPDFHNIIVQVSANEYVDMNGTDVSNYIGTHSNGKKKLLNYKLKVCKRRIEVREGLFAKLGHANADKTAFEFAPGAVPQGGISVSKGYQGITGTCLNSLIPGSSANVLSRG